MGISQESAEFVNEDNDCNQKFQIAQGGLRHAKVATILAQRTPYSVHRAFLDTLRTTIVRYTASSLPATQKE